MRRHQIIPYVQIQSDWNVVIDTVRLYGMMNKIPISNIPSQFVSKGLGGDSIVIDMPTEPLNSFWFSLYRYNESQQHSDGLHCSVKVEYDATARDNGYISLKPTLNNISLTLSSDSRELTIQLIIPSLETNVTTTMTTTSTEPSLQYKIQCPDTFIPIIPASIQQPKNSNNNNNNNNSGGKTRKSSPKRPVQRSIFQITKQDMSNIINYDVPTDSEDEGSEEEGSTRVVSGDVNVDRSTDRSTDHNLTTLAPLSILESLRLEEQINRANREKLSTDQYTELQSLFRRSLVTKVSDSTTMTMLSSSSTNPPSHDLAIKPTITSLSRNNLGSLLIGGTLENRKNIKNASDTAKITLFQFQNQDQNQSPNQSHNTSQTNPLTNSNSTSTYPFPLTPSQYALTNLHIFDPSYDYFQRKIDAMYNSSLIPSRLSNDNVEAVNANVDAGAVAGAGADANVDTNVSPNNTLNTSEKQLTNEEKLQLHSQSDLLGHWGGVSTITWMNNNVLFLTGGYDCSVRLWAPDISRPIRILRGHQRSITAILHLRRDNGRLIATVSKDGCLRIWNISTGHCVSIHTHITNISSKQFENALKYEKEHSTAVSTQSQLQSQTDITSVVKTSHPLQFDFDNPYLCLASLDNDDNFLAVGMSRGGVAIYDIRKVHSAPVLFQPIYNDNIDNTVHDTPNDTPNDTTSIYGQLMTPEMSNLHFQQYTSLIPYFQTNLPKSKVPNLTVVGKNNISLLSHKTYDFFYNTTNAVLTLDTTKVNLSTNIDIDIDVDVDVDVDVQTSISSNKRMTRLYAGSENGIVNVIDLNWDVADETSDDSSNIINDKDTLQLISCSLYQTMRTSSAPITALKIVHDATKPKMTRSNCDKNQNTSIQEPKVLLIGTDEGDLLLLKPSLILEEIPKYTCAIAYSFQTFRINDISVSPSVPPTSTSLTSSKIPEFWVATDEGISHYPIRI